MALAGEAATERNLDERGFSLAEQPFSAVNSPLQHEAMRRFAKLPPERAREIERIHASHFSNRVEG